jgi:lipase
MERAVTEAPGLAVAEWGPPDAEPVLAVHGITASSRSWIELAAALPERRILAPDLRGRGRSLDLPGPWGLRRHADDLAGELRRRGLGPVMVVGHSMGAFVSVALAARHPDLVAALVLVDGGLPLPAPSAGVDGLALLGPAAERLRTRYDSPDAHRAQWRAHPALRDIWSPAVDDYVAYDLVPDGDRWRAAASLAAAAEDIQDLHGPDWYLAALAAVRCPVAFLRAARGLLDEPTALYPAAAGTDARRLLPGSRTVDVPDVNHYSIVLAPAGAAAVADAVRRILPSDIPNSILSPDTPNSKESS